MVVCLQLFIGITLPICMPNINVVFWHTHRMTEKIKVYDQFYRLIPLIVSIHIQIYMIAGKKFFFTLDKTKPCSIYTILTLLLSLDTNYQKHYHSFPTIHLRSTCIQEEKLLTACPLSYKDRFIPVYYFRKIIQYLLTINHPCWTWGKVVT